MRDIMLYIHESNLRNKINSNYKNVGHEIYVYIS